MQTNIIHHKSCLDGLTEIEDASVNLILTSPPYPKGMRDYEEDCCVDADKYVQWLAPLLKASYRVLHPSGSMVLIIMDKIVNGEIHPYLDELKLFVRKMNFKIIDTICWQKTNTLPNVKYDRRPIRAYEHCIWITKNIDLYRWNSDDMRNPYSEATLSRYGAVGRIETLHKRSGGQANQTWLNVEPNPKGAACNNVITGCRYSGRNPGHPARFPDYLPEWFIKAMTASGDVVLDPFAGAGTTLIAAKKMDRAYIGYEIAECYKDRAEEDLKHCFSQIEME